MKTITSHLLCVVAGGMIVAAACTYSAIKKSIPSIPSAISRDLAKVDKETLKCIPVIVYKDLAKNKLGLPQTVVVAPEQRVLGATQVKPNERPTTVSAVLNTTTGETSFYQRQDKSPWLDFNRRYEIGVSYLPFNQDGIDKLIALDGRIEVIQIKALRAGLTGAIDTDGGYKVGVRAWASF